ncbi:unnamed protein product, partial [Rotaria sp. Silwood2]
MAKKCGLQQLADAVASGMGSKRASKKFNVLASTIRRRRRRRAALRPSAGRPSYLP